MVPFAKRRSQRARPCTSRRLTGSYRQNRPQGIAAAYLVVDMIGVFAFAANSFRKDAGTRAELVLICPHLDCELREAVERIVVRRDDGIPRAAPKADRTANSACCGITDSIALLSRKVAGRRARLDERERAFAQVPHADVVVVPHVLRVDRGRIARASEAVVRGDRGVLREKRHLHPHGRDAVRVPRVDLVRNEVPVRVRKAQVSAVCPREVGIAKAADRLREPHERGEVREHYAVLDAREDDVHRLRVLSDGEWVCGKRMRGGNGQRENC